MTSIERQLRRLEMAADMKGSQRPTCIWISDPAAYDAMNAVERQTYIAAKLGRQPGASESIITVSWST